MKRYPWFLLVLACVFCVVGCEEFFELEDEVMTPEQMLNLTPSSEPSDMSVSQLLAQMRKATDPKSAWLNCKSYYMLQTHREASQTKTSSTETYSKIETRFRFDKDDKPEMRIVIYIEDEPRTTMLIKGDKCWLIEKNGTYSEMKAISGKKGGVTKFIGNSNPRMSEQDLYPTIELGVVYEKDVRLYRMVCRTTKDEGAISVRYIDAKTFLPVRLDMVKQKPEGGYLLYRSEPVSYGWRDNVKVPLNTVASIGDDKSESYILEDFKLNVEFKDELFQLPSKAEINYNTVKED